MLAANPVFTCQHLPPLANCCLPACTPHHITLTCPPLRHCLAAAFASATKQLAGATTIMPYHHLRFSAPSTMLAHQHQAADAAAGTPASKPAVIMGPPPSVHAKQQLQQQQQLLPQLAAIATSAAADSRQAAEPEPGSATAEHAAAESLANMAVYIKQEQQEQQLGPLLCQVSMSGSTAQASLAAPTALHEDIAAQHAVLRSSPLGPEASSAGVPLALPQQSPAQRQPTPPPAALQQGLSPHAVQYQPYQDGSSEQQQVEVPAGISTAEPMQQEGEAAAQYVRLGKNGPVITLPPGAFCPAGTEREWPACADMYTALPCCHAAVHVQPPGVATQACGYGRTCGAAYLSVTAVP